MWHACRKRRNGCGEAKSRSESVRTQVEASGTEQELGERRSWRVVWKATAEMLIMRGGGRAKSQILSWSSCGRRENWGKAVGVEDSSGDREYLDAISGAVCGVFGNAFYV